MRIAYFTAGQTGAGHLARGIAVGRGVARAGLNAEYRMFGPALPYIIAPRGDFEAVAIERAELRDPARAESSALASALRAWKPDVLIVDQYWAPLRFILPLAGCEAWMIAHWVPPIWLTGPDDVVRWDPSHYARVIGIEPFAFDGVREHIDPIVGANPDECRPPRALRERFGVPDECALQVVAQAGKPGECDELLATMRARDPRAVTLAFSLFDQRALFPACEWLGGADQIATGAGYNSFWEAHWLGYWPRTTHHAFHRGGGGDQAWRVANIARGTVPRANGADVLARFLA